VRWSPALIGAGLASIAAYFVTEEPNYVWFGISLAPIIIGVALLERLKSPAPLGWLLMLGNASYAIYLVHNPIISIVDGPPLMPNIFDALHVCRDIFRRRLSFSGRKTRNQNDDQFGLGAQPPHAHEQAV